MRDHPQPQQPLAPRLTERSVGLRLEREAPSVEDVWAEAGDMVCFLLGCSFSWENQLAEAGLVPRQIEQGSNVPMYRTNISCRPAGVFSGPMVRWMWPL